MRQATIERRTLLRAALAVVVSAGAPSLTMVTATPAAAADPLPALTLDIAAWKWADLPGTGGLQVWSNVPTRVTWTAQGSVTAGALTVLAAPPPGGRTETMGGGHGLAVRRRAA